jgi:hypothetical protein
MAKRLEDGDPFYKTGDFLIAAREIFKQYFIECEMEIPKWFPEHPFNDYSERGKFIWNELFRTHKTHFDIRDDNSIFISINEFATNPKDKKNIINFLQPECIQEDSSVLVVNKDSFFNFIGYKDVKEQSFIKRFTGYFKSK